MQPYILSSIYRFSPGRPDIYSLYCSVQVFNLGDIVGGISSFYAHVNTMRKGRNRPKRDELLVHMREAYPSESVSLAHSQTFPGHMGITACALGKLSQTGPGLTPEVWSLRQECDEGDKEMPAGTSVLGNHW